MYARAIIAKGDPAQVGELEAFVRDRVDPAVRAMAGNAGMSLFANAATGEVIIATAWVDEQSLTDSRIALTAMRDEGLALLRATDARIETVEPVIMEQKAPDQVGYWTRSVESLTPLDTMLASEEVFIRDVLPQILRIDGVNTVSLLADRAAGKHILNVTYVSRAALEAASAQGQAIRDAFLAEGGRQLVSMMEAEVRMVGMGPGPGPDVSGPDVPAQTGVTDRSTTSTR
ncbi:MAG: hypothetical protein QOC80_941 [Frankiaceae bacterium]|jgi:hypothetical protein|nr:hypothetical protein [Frankiaceae bacterium]MDQ1673285.1 hypothetical protein [Frankiaceae bacterium]